jgi:hypothetical protein
MRKLVTSRQTAPLGGVAPASARFRALSGASVLAVALLIWMAAGVAQAGVADERGQRVLERTLAREHHAVSAPANPAAQAAELALTRTLAREQGAYPAPSARQTANTQPTKPSKPTALFAVVGMVGLTVLLAAAAAFLWQRGRARPREAT